MQKFVLCRNTFLLKNVKRRRILHGFNEGICIGIEGSVGTSREACGESAGEEGWGGRAEKQ